MSEVPKYKYSADPKATGIVYVLKLRHGKYFVGGALNNDRIMEHMDGRGNQWTKLFRPITVERYIKDCQPGDEDKYVRIYMDQYGIHNVRGGRYRDIILSDTDVEYLEKNKRNNSPVYSHEFAEDDV